MKASIFKALSVNDATILSREQLRNVKGGSFPVRKCVCSATERIFNCDCAVPSFNCLQAYCPGATGICAEC